MNGATLSEVGELVKATRIENGWSQENLAMECKTGQCVISRLEGGRVPTFGLLDRVARAFGCRLVISFVKSQTRRKEPKNGKRKAV